MNNSLKELIKENDNLKKENDILKSLTGFHSSFEINGSKVEIRGSRSQVMITVDGKIYHDSPFIEPKVPHE